MNSSIWQATAPAGPFPTLAGDIQTDVAIVGGGITGITLAALLTEAGRRVVVLEAFQVGDGTTGHSTGNLYATVGGRLYKLRDRWDVETARRVVQSRSETVGLIEKLAQRSAPECDFRRVPHHIYAVEPGEVAEVEREYEATREVGLSAHLQSSQHVRSAGRVLVMDGQAQFHPLAFVRGVASAAASAGCQIFENTPMLEIDDKQSRVRTAKGTVTALEIVLATHTPKGLFALHAEMPVHREYAVAGRPISGVMPEGINWGLAKEGHSVRSLTRGSDQWLIVVGSEVKTGRHDGAAELAKVELEAQEFGLREIEFRWGAQNYQSPDRIPYIGRSLGSDIFVATGFAADGLTYGVLAARIIADEMLGRSNPYADLYAARRVTPVKSAARIVEENVVVMKSFVQDYITDRKTISLDSLPPDTAAIVDHEGKRVAAYRAQDGSVTMVSPACTHLKCIVHWNSAERSWDCPCHGSRFATDGRVLEGPAITPLPSISSLKTNQ
ncbi:MAG TPA: FAD-dependent oxidoreductase [Burkholderiaceae bacterium]|nr:FAD-dependent oxidoreductase [Burkholderiaceae bacterium]